MLQKRLSYQVLWILPITLFIALVIAGGMATQYLGNNARQEVTRNSEASSLTLLVYITSELQRIEGAVKSLAGSPWILPALISRKDQDIERANIALDRYNDALNASVSYLMDVRGITLASSNRNDPDTFIGTSYHFRSYFQESIKGNPGQYFGLGVTSGKRGFYASFPVRDRKGDIRGVIAMKKDLDEMGTFFRKYDYCFLINQAGVIFLSSKPELIFRSLWPLGKEMQESLTSSRQFGDKPFDAIHDKEMTDGMDIRFGGNDYLVSRKVVNRDGWSIVLLTLSDQIFFQKMIGIITTVSLCLFVVIFSGIIYFVNKSRQIIRHSERKFQMITSNVRDAIIVINHEGNITFWNESAEKIFGYASQEVLGRHYLPLIVPQRNREDFDKGFIGFRTTGEGFAIGKTMEMEALRKDGTKFPVEISLSATQFRDQWLAVGIVRDMTRRKQYEQEILSMSITDPLTGLYNRRGFITLAEQQLKIAERTKNRLLLLFADLDGMKWINDHLGHMRGDVALVEAAAVLKAVFREADILARVGGDEFAVLALGVSSEDSDLLRNRLQQQIDLHNNHENRDYQLSISVGIAYKEPDIPASIDDLMSRADALMYEEKRSRKNST